MKRIICIVGPTAVGKTDLALTLAHLVNGEIISADSRQVYRGMDIGTGKDVPPGAKKKSHRLKFWPRPIVSYSTSTTAIWGYDLLYPQESWSSAQFRRFADGMIAHLYRRGKVPIIVGGSGFYLQSLMSPPSSLTNPINQTLRNKLSNETVDRLQKKLSKLNPQRFNSLNHSDRHNPRRLIRAIEIALQSPADTSTPKPYEALVLGLKLPLATIDNRIVARVKQRIAQGFNQECKKLLRRYPDAENHPASLATGYRQWFQVQTGEISEDEMPNRWIIAEKQYARRQLVWFKKQSGIQWLSVDEIKNPNHIAQKVALWYSNSI